MKQKCRHRSATSIRRIARAANDHCSCHTSDSCLCHQSSRSRAVLFQITLTRRSTAPKKLTRAKLLQLFKQAWNLIPNRRCPDEFQGQTRVAVDVLIVDDKEIAALNVSHLKTRGPTDVLAFPMGEIDIERRAYHLGEIVVSFETAAREAAARKLNMEQELYRYCVHGFLHLLGYKDATTTQRKKLFMLQEKTLKI
ncbi:MAG: rRNA maturation RNase YbeY [Planctomycetota bacterium]